MQNSPKQEILYANFNQDNSNNVKQIQAMFCVGTDSGFRAIFQRDLKGGIGIVEMLYRTNILALVGGGVQPKYPDNKVMIWDDHQVKCIAELSFRGVIKNVKLRQDRIVVVQDTKIYVYNFTDLKLLDQIETYVNLRGIVSISTSSDLFVLATLGQKVGQVLVHRSVQPPVPALLIQAHSSPVSYLALDSKGSKLATASEKGTVIRIYSVLDGKMLQDVRRGTDYATITSITFDQDVNWVACASDSGTIHIFRVSDETNNQQVQNPSSMFKMLGPIIPILKSQWSFSQFRIQDTRCKLAFINQDTTFIVISQEGNFYKATMQKN
ncbi:hypothetical protein pb186bvf_009342 [Paramecium bursaria]